jgi:hypothetical protein
MRPLAIFGRAFLDGFGLRGLFLGLKPPGYSTQLFADALDDAEDHGAWKTDPRILNLLREHAQDRRKAGGSV